MIAEVLPAIFIALVLILDNKPLIYISVFSIRKYFNLKGHGAEVINPDD